MDPRDASASKNIAQAERDKENAGFEKGALTSSMEARSGKRIL